MSESSSDQLKMVDVRAPLARVLLVVPVVLALVGAWYATRWYFGNVVAEYAPQIVDETLSEEGLAATQLEAAQTALRLAPDDPWTHWVVAGLKKNSFKPEDFTDALKHFEEAARLSPNDYRFWVSLGRAREQAGDPLGGERALRRAVELAPAYADPRWHLGNLLLRAGRGDDAFTELRRASDADPRLRPQIFNAAWVVYGEDVDAINRAAGGSAAARAELAFYVAGRGRFDEALRLWSSLTPAEKQEQRASGEAIVNALLTAKRHRDALAVGRELGAGPPAVKIGEVSNPGFEDEIEATAANVFGWKVRSVPQAPIGFDQLNKHGGARSLRVAFKSPSALAFANISQLIVVEPGQQYRLEFYVRTEELKSGGTPLVEVLDGADSKTVLAATPTLDNGTHDWQGVALDFRAPPQSEAIVVRVRREACGDDAVCPIFGLVWYDDFNLQRIGANAAPAKGNARTPLAR